MSEASGDVVDVPCQRWRERRDSYRPAREPINSALPEVRAVLAYSDPVRRTSMDGRIVLPGHVGTIYQAFNARYVGRAGKRTLHMDPTGRVVSGRAETKIRKGERGAGPEVDRIVAAGGRRPRMGEDMSAWLADVLSAPPFRTLRHPGNHTYVWPIDGKRATTKVLAPPAGPYPKLSLEPTG